MLNQGHHGADILAEIGQRVGGVRQNGRIVSGHFEGSPRKIGALQAVRLRILAPTVKMQPMTAECSPGQRLGGIRQDARVVAGRFQGSPGEVNALQTVCRPVFAPAVMKQPIAAIRGPGECGSYRGSRSIACSIRRSASGIWRADDQTIA